MKKWNSLYFCTILLSIATTGFATQSVFPVQAVKIYAQCTPLPTDDAAPDFCKTFPKSVGYCSHIPSPNRQQMQSLYNILLSKGSLLAGCTYYSQHGFNYKPQDCVDEWTCYWNGGVIASKGKLCAGDGKPCPSSLY